MCSFPLMSIAGDKYHPLSHMVPTLKGKALQLPNHVKFARRTAIKNHLKDHQIVKRSFRTFDNLLFCPWCYQSFYGSAPVAREHIRNWHGPQLEYTHRCVWPFDNECKLQLENMTMKDDEAVIRHMASHLGPPLICATCAKFFWKQVQLDRHAKNCPGHQ